MRELFGDTFYWCYMSALLLMSLTSIALSVSSMRSRRRK